MTQPAEQILLQMNEAHMDMMIHGVGFVHVTDDAGFSIRHRPFKDVFARLGRAIMADPIAEDVKARIAELDGKS